jgi:hypothetical protein
MTKAATLRTLAMAALIAAATPALAHGTGPRGPAADNTGIVSLGVDITLAGTSPESVGDFLTALPKVRQRSLVYACRSIEAAPLFANRRVLGFCNVLVDLTRSVPPASPPPRWGD